MMRIKIITAKGELKLADSQDICSIIKEFIKQNFVHVILDMSGVSSFSHLGIHNLFTSRQRLKEYGGDLKIVGLNGHLVSVFSLSGYSTEQFNKRKGFSLYSTEDDACQAFSLGLS